MLTRVAEVSWLSSGSLLLKALRKQDGFRWKLYKSKIAFVEGSTKVGWLSLKAMWKPFKKRVNRDNTKFRDEIVYVGGPSFRRRPWLFSERCSCNIGHPDVNYVYQATMLTDSNLFVLPHISSTVLILLQMHEIHYICGRHCSVKCWRSYWMGQ